MRNPRTAGLMTLLGTVKLVQTTSVYLLVTFWSKDIKYAIFTAFSFFLL